MRHDTWALGGPGASSRHQAPGGCTPGLGLGNLALPFPRMCVVLFSSCSCKKGRADDLCLWRLLTASDVWRKNFFAGKLRPGCPWGN